jgi:predicted O-methyltransferase YrrM
MPSITRRAKNLVKGVLPRVFRLGQRAGVDILPRHFYSSIPDFRELGRNDHWKRPQSMTGVRGAEDVDAQLRFAAECCTEPLRKRLAADDLYAAATAESGEVGYGPVEADFLFCFISTRRPARVVQAGAGFSTAVMLRAAREAGFPLALTCIEPYPSDYLRRLARDRTIQLIDQRAQDVEPAVFTNLAAGDLLFIDSTHTVKVGSEVNYFVLEILPRIPAGAFVHFHDIYFPYDYHRTLMSDVLFPGESTLLHAFLIGNEKYEIAAALSMLHHARAKELGELIPRYRPQRNDHGLAAEKDGHFPSAVYLRVVK